MYPVFVRVALVITLGAAIFAHPLRAAQGTRDMLREARIETELEKRSPALLEPFRNARLAYDRGDFVASENLYRQVLDALPTYDVAARRLGAALVAQGKHNEGLAYCEKAVALQRTSANVLTLAYSLAYPKQGQSSTAARERALKLLQECKRLPGGDDVDRIGLTAQLALQMKRIPEFREALAELQAKHPQTMVTHYLAAVAHAMDEKWMSAEREIRVAGKLGLAPETVRAFLESGVQSTARGWRAAMYTGMLVGGWMLGLVLLSVIGFVLSKVVLRQANNADVNLPVSQSEHRLRAIYRSVLNLGGVYYYISLPIVALMVVGVSGGVLYALLVAGWLPIKLLVVVVIVALVTLWTMAKSLFIRVKSEDPGRALRRDEAPELWRLTDEVAQTMNTRPIDEIRITPGTDLAVYERGSWREKLRNKASRVLILGTGVINGFKQDDFRCVLAHEYGHFSNRDTAGGDIALRVRNDMMKFYIAMFQAGQATYLNLAFHFLRVYNFIFRRISHGATRLQEILADRVAAQYYGAAALEGGLRHVIWRSLEFQAVADREIKAGIEARRPLQNLYETSATELTATREEFEKAINRPTTDDDTHPSPRDRFRLIATLNPPLHASRAGEVWDLFQDRDALLREMMAQIEENVASHRESSDPSYVKRAG